MSRPVAPAPTWLWRAAADIRARRSSPELERLAEAIEDFRETAHLGQTIEAALGLETPADRRPWHAVAPDERRAELLEMLVRRAADEGCELREIARQILAECRRFERRLLSYLEGEIAPRDLREAALLKLYRMARDGGPKWPLAERRLRDLITDVLGSRLPDSGAETAHPLDLACSRQWRSSQ